MGMWRDSSGRLTFDCREVKADDVPAVCRSLADAFGLSPAGGIVSGLEQKFRDFHRDDQAVGLDWDIWMGFTATAQSSEAEPLVEEIAGWIAASLWSRADMRDEPDASEGGGVK